ncbi:Ribonuclease VapC [Candidatus Desulfarcum epimagneticum]|uniref:Ribonuclease VapC n=1 Tax=uncultured Desulfobacteraceae bacterium TaxID=218296 RepID=A0A484HQW6_9BACT|nr:Ribonuclease VapC [uncultured Desulfobacteraceae bacterium]
MKNKYVLDTSAIFTFLEDEPGADDVESLLDKAEEGGAVIFLSFMTFAEVYYISFRKRGKDVAERRVQELFMMPVIRVDSNAESSYVAGRIKASRRMSMADAWIAALAKIKKAALVHKDPEFESIENEVEVLKLPYKNAN